MNPKHIHPLKTKAVVCLDKDPSVSPGGIVLDAAYERPPVLWGTVCNCGPGTRDIRPGRRIALRSSAAFHELHFDGLEFVLVDELQEGVFLVTEDGVPLEDHPYIAEGGG